jgi:hypothetical protein
MRKHCPYCGLATGDLVRCALCNTSLVKGVNLRRVLLWALVIEEYLVVGVAMLRFA